MNETCGPDEGPDQVVASFGKDAALGCFVAEPTLDLSRGDLVVLRTMRGLEVGSVLCAASVRQARLLGANARGEVARRFGPGDEETHAESTRRADRLRDAANDLAERLAIPATVLDAEVFFDGVHAVLHLLHDESADLAAFARELSQSLDLEVRLSNLAQPLPEDPESHGCGKPDCGEGSGSCTTCSTGGCATGCGSAAVDLRNYFSHLRDQMEATQRVPLV